MTSTQDLLKQAADLASSNPKRAEELYKQILDSTASTSNGSAVNAEKEQSLRDQESALIKLAELYRDQKDASGLAQAKTAKLIRTLLNHFNSIPTSRQAQIDVLTGNIEWSKREKRIFLKHSLEIRLVSLQLEALQYKLALTRINALLTELKRLDDKTILTEVHPLESRVYRGIGNLSKSKAALTSARTAANSIYCPPHLQAALDFQFGVLHAEDKDYTTTYSYFYETFENMSSQDDPAALNALKYMLLFILICVPARRFLSIKLAVKYAQLREIESMRAIALAHQNRNLADFETALRDYKHGTSGKDGRTLGPNTGGDKSDWLDAEMHALARSAIQWCHGLGGTLEAVGKVVQAAVAGARGEIVGSKSHLKSALSLAGENHLCALLLAQTLGAGMGAKQKDVDGGKGKGKGKEKDDTDSGDRQHPASPLGRRKIPRDIQAHE
ncbi:hypothetical protein EV702DRAFT_1281457 [Suillus placidus]|uniref:26S proteasome regulatory subunit Rpn6 N-terminal domain-containing protein n=1 Tax=Suillus placidus TaxID=48579 RepID=A0A9P7CYV0_9AGAM|nr:hypothetical protein EV702DRAFT_1281457 [Suillus placidus]